MLNQPQQNRFIRITVAVVLPALFALSSGCSCHKARPSAMPMALLSFNGKTITAEVANTPATRESGLMFHRGIEKNDGMLFVFPDSAPRAFWMKNTYIPLSIAFMDGKGVILNFWEMPALTEQTFMSAGPAKFALEMNTGWFSANGAKPGDKIAGVVEAPPAKE